MWFLRVMGTPAVEHEGEPVRLERRKSLALLVYLRNQPHALARDHLAATLWPDQDTEHARASLRSALADLTRVLGADCIERTHDTLRFDARFQIPTDVDAISQPAQDSTLATLLERAALYRGPFLEGFDFPELPGFSEWVYFKRESAEQAMCRLLASATERALGEQQYSSAEDCARRWIRHNPLDEAAWRALMNACYASGKRGEIGAAFRDCARTLKDELGIEPAPETRALHDALVARLDNRDVPAVAPATKSKTIPRIEYFLADDAHIAYSVLGDGEKALVLIGGFLSHLEQFWEEPGLARFLTMLSEHCRLVVFDKRGVGLSDRTGALPTIERVGDDVIALLDHLKLPRAFVMGVSEGGPSAIHMAHRYPQRIDGLVLYATAAKWTRTEDYPYAVPAPRYQTWLTWLEANWGMASNLEQFAPSRKDDQALAHWWAKTLRLAASPGSIRRVLEAAQHTDVRALLPALRVPTLVVHRRDDVMIRIGNGRYLAEHIPGAQLLEVDGSDHWFWVGQMSEFERGLQDFLAHPTGRAGHASARP